MAKYRYRIEGGRYGGELVCGEVNPAFASHYAGSDEQELIEAVLESEDYEPNEDLFASTVEYIIPMPAPNFYFISQIQPEQVEEIFNDLLRWLRDGYDF